MYTCILNAIGTQYVRRLRTTSLISYFKVPDYKLQKDYHALIPTSVDTSRQEIQAALKDNHLEWGKYGVEIERVEALCPNDNNATGDAVTSCPILPETEEEKMQSEDFRLIGMEKRNYRYRCQGESEE
jgi:hypothetical protein